MTSFGPISFILAALTAYSECDVPSLMEPAGAFWVALPLVSLFLVLAASSIRLWLRPGRPKQLGLSMAGIAASVAWGLSFLGVLISLAIAFSGSTGMITTLVLISVSTGFLMLVSVAVFGSGRMRSHVAEVSASGGRARRIGMYVCPSLAIYCLFPTTITLFILFGSLYFEPCNPRRYEPEPAPYPYSIAPPSSSIDNLCLVESSLNPHPRQPTAQTA
jgi:hypothetical protein